MKQILAMGGGGFSMEPDNPLLDFYVLNLAAGVAKGAGGHSRPRVCFIPTASGDSDSYVENFYRSFRRFECKPSHLSLFKGSTPDIEGFLLNQDILYVGGGNTRNLLTLWRDWGVDQAVRKAYDNGIILSGISAGALCWFQEGVTDSVPGRLSGLKCLGLLEGSHCPHYDGEAERRPSYHSLLEAGEIGPGLAAEDGVALHFVDGRLAHVVSSHPTKRAFRVQLAAGGAVQEESLEPRYLGDDVSLTRGFAIIRRAAATAREARGVHDAHMRSIREVCGPHYTPEEVAAWGGRPYREDHRLKCIREHLVWVVELDGGIEGYAHVIPDSTGTSAGGEGPRTRSAELAALYLSPKVVGRGLGSRILALIGEEMRDIGVTKLSLESTLNARAFYAKHGFRETGPETTRAIGGVPVRCMPMSR